MEFQMLLFKVGTALSMDNVKALAFLCTDILKYKKESVKSANDLFSRLVEQDHLSDERRHLLTELLRTIQRHDLVREFHLSDGETTTTSLISTYRKLLYNLSEELTEEDSNDVKFLLKDELPRKILEGNSSLLEVFLRMEQMDFLADDNLNKLEIIIQHVCPRLMVLIAQFKAQQDFSTEASSSASYLCSDTLGLDSQGNRTLPEGHHQTSTKSRALGTYSMTQAKRGICVIINNFLFPLPGLKDRVGTGVDEQCLSDVFKWLGFGVEVHADCTSEKMLSVMGELGKRDHSRMDCVVCCVLSHGLEGRVYGVDSHTVEIRDLKEPLNALNCPTLAEKPKLFFIQACQGKKEQRAVYIQADGNEPSLVCDALKESIPAEADFLMSMATVPSFASFRDTKRGTWFIQSLCKNLIELVPRGLDLLSILTKVNDDVSLQTKHEGEKKQMPQQASTLRKNVVFPVPETPSPRLPSV
ncbi:caspase-8 isoform X2 [Platichthys flesus]|uniref:caspase-8 isoform X2 n=1 Tax=Platichthys flesus TaxID=8260 RepID=UPI002DBAF40E|nr:caspase-8 isoform X2 [Platichthys flesus]